MTASIRNFGRFRSFVTAFTELVGSERDESLVLDKGAELLSDLVRHDDWLPAECAQPHPQFYQQYLLHCDPLERFSVVSFVWGPDQKTPIHDHSVWGLVGVMRGAEKARAFRLRQDGEALPEGEWELLRPGDVDKLSPAAGDIHKVENAFSDQVSISIHVYGANIGAVKRRVFDPATGAAKPFVSGYSSKSVPNFWDYSEEVRRSATAAV